MPHNFPIVALGASAGGLEAVTQLLEKLPAQPGMAFVLVQHLSPDHASELVTILSRVTPMHVAQVQNGDEVQPNRVYVIGPEHALEIAHDRFVTFAREHGSHAGFLIDRFLRSLAHDAQTRAVAVILSGGGTDGELGAREIKGAGGVVIAQDEASAQQAGMPRAAALAGCVDFVLPPAEIAAALMRISDHRYLTSPPGEAEQSDNDDYDSVIAFVRSATGIDFSQYRATTLRRRILRRAMLFGHSSVTDYLARLRGDKAEVQALHFDLLINVTSFFRDASTFDCLKTRVIPAILDAKEPHAPVRVWVPGCSTGQEAYSIAMLLLECLDGRPHHAIQIFATDLSGEDVLATARAGLYPQSIEQEMSQERLARFFDRVDGGYRIRKVIRDLCVFAQQNVTSDPPFSHVDLITCRNVLIYMSPALQQRVIPIFHYALNVPGYLVLGPAESVGQLSHHFEPVDRHAKVYAKKDIGTSPASVSGNIPPRATAISAARGEYLPSLADFRGEVDRLLLARYAPPGVLIDENLNVLEFRGRTARYLEMPTGEPTTSLLKLAQSALVAELTKAVRNAKTVNAPVTCSNMSLSIAGRTRAVDVEVIPVAVAGAAYRCFLVLFHDGIAPAGGRMPEPGLMRELMAWAERLRAGRTGREKIVPGAEIERLQQEHHATKEFLQSLLDERDSGNEELRAANEEVLSANEELQSTNEELETAKEELQSVNEELTTVNEQLNARNTELTQINNDFTNLLASTNIPLVAVGSDLHIRFNTAPAAIKMNLLPSDIGRPIGHIRPAIAVNNLEDLVRRVIETQQPLQQDLRDRDDRWHSLRIFPYRVGNRVEGAVIVLVDIDDVRRGQDLLQQQASMLKLADQRKNEFLAMLGHELRNPLGPLANVLQILQLPQSTREQRMEALGVFERQLAQLTRIVEDLLDATRISQGKIELKREYLDLNVVLRAAVETSRPSLEASDHRLETRWRAEGICVDADPLRLTQVIVNLLNNAAKYTPRNGNIALTCNVSTERPDQAEIRVRDNGIGMSAELRARVFELFTEGDTYENRRRGGLGIGLTLARTLVEMHGGEIEARSAGEGHGSEFIVRLPLAAPAEQSTGDMPRGAVAAMAPQRILVIEDNVDQAQTLAALLSLWGHEVKTANEGGAGLKLAGEFNPRVVLIDLGLPSISGYEVARRLRQHPELKTCLLIAQTGWGDSVDRRRTREAGFDFHLLKPLDPEELRDVLARPRDS